MITPLRRAAVATATVFPPEFPSPRLEWRDPSPRARAWTVDGELRARLSSNGGTAPSRGGPAVPAPPGRDRPAGR